MSKQYIGVRLKDRRLHVWVVAEQERYSLVHVVQHSSNLECGYLGSGPADLALSILTDLFNEKPAIVHGHLNGSITEWRSRSRASDFYQAFKRDVIAKLPREGDWQVSEDEINAWIKEFMT